MNDRQDPYGPAHGYDEYGRPLYGTVRPPAPDGSREDDPYGPGGEDYGPDGGPSGAPEGYDPAGGYGYGAAQPPTRPAPGYQPYPDYRDHREAPSGPPGPADQGQGQGHDQGYGYGGTYGDGYGGYDYGTGEQPAVADPAPHPAGPPAQPPPDLPPQRAPGGETPGRAAAPGTAPAPGARPADPYDTGQFAFVEEGAEDSQDVIDWLKFTESRTERREEAKRRSRNRRRFLAVLLVLALLGGTGWLWASGRLPGFGEPGASTAVAEERDVIVVHLRQADSDETATALLVANETEGSGTTLLLPNDLSVTTDGGTVPLSQAVLDEPAGAVRDALGGLLGADIRGTWRLGTPYLEILVDLVGGVTLTTDAEVPGEDGEEPLVPRGENVRLDGRAAVAYATHSTDEEPPAAQLSRFGQVLQAVLERMPSGEEAAIRTTEAIPQVTDPSLPAGELGASLGRLAGYAQGDAYQTVPLPVEEDGTLSDATSDGLVADILGGSVSNADPDGAPRIAIRDAGGDGAAAEAARVTLVNGGFTVVDSRTADRSERETRIAYADEAHRGPAEEVARTLGLDPAEVVTQGEGAANADVTIVLGGDYGQ
ncbi:LytR C-terminal domain-containing protein [Streptomyces sp. DSM 44917]|uniref:LytR C-terminal domain-containing protein n=1 Tax=Streptomyces boetiae TaxID=3075541 RepID=A0ABU2L8F9_9ACTN|nr:LytR C-terminal domain-containing protein [Streptomyces sp. DSM 44917]MDT0307627.1 LytR C-terminal domain-containing protein [Streptomyces sp. DSM 44917]